MKWLPYLTQLSRCPGALKYTGIYQILPKVVKGYLEGYIRSDKRKVLAAIASLTERSGFGNAVETVGTALMCDATDVGSLINLYLEC